MTEDTDADRPDEPTDAAAKDQTATIGRGALYLTMTKLYFIVGSYAIYFGIPRLGGESGDALFAEYKLIGAMLSVIGTVLVMGTTQAISRFVGREPEKARGIVGRGLKLQLGLGLIIAGTYFVLAPMNQDAEVATAIRISALIPLLYAAYSVFMGTLNGEKRFAEQALMDGGFTTLKILCVLGFIAVFQSSAGGYAGFAAAAAGVFVASGLIVRKGHAGKSADIGDTPTIKDMFLFQMQTVGFMLLVQWVVQMDIWYVEWWGPYEADTQLTLPPAEGADPSTAVTITQTKAAAALYGSTQLFSQISYSVVISLTFVLFPLISGLGEDKEAARRYVREALRYALIMVAGVIACLTAVPGATMNLLLRDLASNLQLVPSGDEALRWLGLGYGAFSLLFVLCAVLNAAGRPRHSIALMAVTLGVQCGLGFVLLPEHGIVGQGVAGLIAMSLGLSFGLVYMARWIGNVIPTSTVVRVAIAGAAAYGLALTWHPEGKLMTLVRVSLCGAVYLGVIIASREFGADDIAKFKKVIPGGKKT